MISQYPFTIITLVAIIGASLYAWSNNDFYNKWIFHPNSIKNQRQYYRFLTSGFIHLDYVHLIFNCLVLYSFGVQLELYYSYIIFTPAIGGFLFLSCFIIGVIVSSIPTYFKHKDNYYYRALGASGGVSSVLIATIFIVPGTNVSLLFLPIEIPGVLFAALYMIFSYYQGKRNADNIGHDAHLYGALFGLLFVLLTYPQAFLITFDRLLNNF